MMKCAVLSALIAAAAGAAEIHVPLNQPTIQAAINAALAGDVVIVDDGTWSGPGNTELTTLGKAITVRSANGAGVCTIDGGDTVRVFNISSGEGLATVIDGFSIVHGRNNLGGGIRCENTSPTIRNCIFEHNDSPDINGSGGAIRCSNAKPLIKDCSFVMNTSSAWGGAIFLDNTSNATITGCSFNTNASSKGGAIYAQNSSNATVSECSFENNSAQIGAAVFNWGSSPTYLNCLFESNLNGFNGGAMASTNNAKPLVVNALFLGNTAVNGGGAYGFNASPKYVNCTFVKNEVSSRAGGGLFHSGSGTSTASNCIFWDNLPDQVAPSDGSVALTNCSIEGGWRRGSGNDGTDPLFVDPDTNDYRLATLSPCIDSAVLASLPATVATDLDGNPRVVAGMLDRGAYEWQGPALGDINADGVIDGADLGLLLAAWGSCSACDEDLNQDGAVDGADLGLLLAVWS